MAAGYLRASANSIALLKSLARLSANSSVALISLVGVTSCACGLICSFAGLEVARIVIALELLAPEIRQLEGGSSPHSQSAKQAAAPIRTPRSALLRRVPSDSFSGTAGKNIG